MTQPDRLTYNEARIRAEAARRISLGQGNGVLATSTQKVRARKLHKLYKHAAECLKEVDSE